VAGEPVAKFHLVVEGSALLLAGTDEVALAEGELAVVPRGSAHTRYLSEVRLLAAARQLEAGGLTLGEIARGAGYASDAAFAKAFKRRLGASPGKYRARANEPPQIQVEALR
jgi:AraC-like DNA-binding protein